MNYSYIAEEERARIIEFYEACQNMKQTAKHCNRSYSSVKRIVKKSGSDTKTRKLEFNLCVDCKRAARFNEYPCPWASSFEEVPGWEAKKIEKPNSTAGTEWFYIKKCPLFMPDD